MDPIKSGLEALKAVVAEIESAMAEKKCLDAKISDLKKQEEQIRSVIHSEMNEANSKELIFNGLGQVVVRKGPRQFIIDDETAFADLAKRSNRYDDIFKTEIKMSKTAANKFLSHLQSCGSLPGCVSVKDGEVGISVTWEKEEPKPAPKVTSKPKESGKDILEDLDTL